jgi:hypothetical protein
LGGEELVCSKWLNINKDRAYRKIISYVNVTKLTGKDFFRTKCKWVTKVWGEDTTSLGLPGSKNVKCENGSRIEIVTVQ